MVEEVVTTPNKGTRGNSKAPKEDKKDKAAAASTGEVKEGGNIMSTIKIGNATINLENVNITNYVCDFGNVVVGFGKKKSFRLTNTGKIPILSLIHI